MRDPFRSSGGIGFGCALALISAAALAQPETAATTSATPVWPDPAGTDSELLPRANSALLLDVAELGRGALIAVGERGHVLLSDDGGVNWRQVEAPTRSTLTAVTSRGDTVVAAGHDGIILHSGDRGATWTRVREEPFSIDNMASSSNGSPILDLLFLDDTKVVAVGAYSLMLASDDGGLTWTEQPFDIATGDDGTSDLDAPAGDGADVDGDDGMDDEAVTFDEADLALGDEADPHLNAIVRLGSGRLIVVGERGTVFRSDNDGQQWQRLNLPYGGSMYGALPLGHAGVIVYGLRGRVFESRNGGEDWAELDSGSLSNLFGGSIDRDGGIVLVGSEGAVLRTGNGRSGFDKATYVTDTGETPALAGALRLEGGPLVLLGERGVARWEETP